MPKQTVVRNHDLSVESVLSTFAREYLFHEVPMSSVLRAQSMANQVRTEKALDDETVKQYVLLAQYGTVFPAIVVYTTLKGLVVIGGNHRFEMSLFMGYETIWCYQFDDPHDPQMLKDIGTALNLTNGRPEPREHRIDKAAHDVITYSTSVEDASRKYGVEIHVIRERVARHETYKRLAEKHVIVPSIAGSNVTIIGTIKNDNVMVATALTIERSKLKSEELKTMVRKVKAPRTEAAQMKEVVKWAEQLGVSYEIADSASKPKARAVNSVTSDFRRALTKLELVLDGKRSFASLGISSTDDRELYEKRVVALCTTLQGIVRGS